MELSKDSVRLLRWMRCHDKWMYIETLQKRCSYYEYRSFAALKDASFVDAVVFDYEYENPEYDEDGTEWYRESYRISDKGKAYLENLSTRWLPEFREWIAIGISVAAFILSVIALTAQLGLLPIP